MIIYPDPKEPEMIHPEQIEEIGHVTFPATVAIHIPLAQMGRVCTIYSAEFPPGPVLLLTQSEWERRNVAKPHHP